MIRPFLSNPSPGIDAGAINRFARIVFDGLAGFVDVRLLTDKGMPDQPPRCYSLPVNHGLVPALVRCAAEAPTTGRACYVVPASTAKRGRARAKFRNRDRSDRG